MSVATARELKEATLQAREALQERSREKQLESWLRWFDKRIDQMLKDAIRMGLGHLYVELPFQPLQGGEQKQSYLFADGEHLSMKVKKMLEGVELDYTELEELDGSSSWILELRWC